MYRRDNLDDISGINRLVKNLNRNRKKTYNSEVTKIVASETDREIKCKNEKESEDTKQRKEIQEVIKKMVRENKGKIEILTYLTNNYPNAKVAPFFETYINREMKKFGKLQDEPEGR